MPPPSRRNMKKRASSLDCSNARKASRTDYAVSTSNVFSALSVNNQPVQPSKPARPAPITVTDEINVATHLKDATFPYRLKMVSIGTKIYVDKEDDFKHICDALKAKDIEYFTHPFGEAKTFKLILSGLPELPTADITNWLKSQNNITVNRIIMLNSGGSHKRYLVQFNPKENNRTEVMNIKVILNHVIKWIPAKNNRKGPSQCLRCAMFGHGISACNRKPTCLLCGEAHETKDCSFSGTDDSEQRIFKCFNCKAKNLQHNHKASDPLCPCRINYIEIRSSANNRKPQATQQRQQQYVHTPEHFPPLSQARPTQLAQPLTRSFADAAKHTPRQQFNSHVNAQRDRGDDLFTFAEVSDILFSCINELEKCKSKFDQMRVIANMLSNVCK